MMLRSALVVPARSSLRGSSSSSSSSSLRLSCPAPCTRRAPLLPVVPLTRFPFAVRHFSITGYRQLSEDKSKHRHEAQPAQAPTQTIDASVPTASTTTPSSATTPTTAPAPKTGTWHSVKSFVKWYYRGMQQVGWNYQTSKLLKRAADPSKNPSSPYTLTRQDQRLISTSFTDVLKIPPILVFVALAEEMLPIMILFLPDFIPSPCHVPSQVHEAHEEHEVDLIGWNTKLATELEGYAVPDLQGKGTRKMPWNVVKTLAKRYRINTITLPFLVRRNLVKHQVYLDKDDQILLSAVAHPSPLPAEIAERTFTHPSAASRALILGNSIPEDESPLALAELARACRERGLRSLGLPPSELRSLLSQWLAISQAEIRPCTAEERMEQMARRSIRLFRDDQMEQLHDSVAQRRSMRFWKKVKTTLRGIIDAGAQPSPPRIRVAPKQE